MELIWLNTDTRRVLVSSLGMSSVVSVEKSLGYFQVGTSISIHGAMSTACRWGLSPLAYTPYHTILLWTLAGWYLQLCAMCVTNCKVGSPYAQGSQKWRHTRGDFVAETWTCVANFAVACLRHMHGSDRYYTAFMGDYPSGVSDGG